jgi:neutral ceramidase
VLSNLLLIALSLNSGSIITSSVSDGAVVMTGASSVRITPSPGVPMAGYYSTRYADGVHDDLYARALVLESGGTKACLVTLDLISTTRELVESARRRASESAGIPPANIMISATHAHTGPVLANRSSRDDALGSSSEAARKYTTDLAGRIAEAVRQANANLAPSRLFAGKFREDRISFNRRFFMKDGTVGWNPGKLNPNIVRPAGPIDPEVKILYADTPQGKPIATYVNFALHLDTVGGTHISADFPFTLSRLLAETKTPEMVTLFANGCCGNINHIDVAWADKQHGNDEACRIGTILAADVLNTYKQMKSLSPGNLRVLSEAVKLPLPPIRPGDVEHARGQVARYGTKDAPKFLEIVDAFKILDVAERNGAPQDVEVQVVALGNDAAWVSLPGEIFVELGLAIKKASPFKYTFVAELANGSIGYIPDSRAYAQGNYEVISARCAKGSGEILVNAAVRMLRKLYSTNMISKKP